MPEKWKCNVCGYLHEGTEPLPRCPRCGTDGRRFIPLQRVKFNLLYDLAESFIPHPVLSHFPCALVPAALILLALDLWRGPHAVPEVVFYLLLLGWLAVPILMISGLHDWKTRFSGVRATIFYKKIALAGCLFLVGALLLALRLARPKIFAAPGGGLWVVLGLTAVMLVCTILLGHYGGKLTFQWKKRQG